MLGVYLAACKARHNDYNILYNDIDKRYKPDLLCDMLEVPLNNFDFVIATPPCNYWSKANPYYKSSNYSLLTKHLLPDTIKKLACFHRPFIIENVKNEKRMYENGIFQLLSRFALYYQFVGRHIYITNRMIDLTCQQHFDFSYGGKRVNNDGYNQGGSNVHSVIEIWLKAFCKE